MLWTGQRVPGKLSFPRLSHATAEGGMASFAYHPESVALGAPCGGTMLGCMDLCCVSVLERKKESVLDFQTVWVIFWY